MTKLPKHRADPHVLQLSSLINWNIDEIADLKIAAFDDDGTCDLEGLSQNLASSDVAMAREIKDLQERRHFVVRRCFQSIFLRTVLKVDLPLSALGLVHTSDTRPKCILSPNCCLSFSSSGTTYIAGASFSQSVGLDIERIRSIANVVALSQRFFLAEEAASIEHAPVDEQNLAFLKIWTIKEASLKAHGKCILDGLNTFKVSIKAGTYMIESPSINGSQPNCSTQHLDFMPEYIVAVVHMPRERGLINL